MPQEAINKPRVLCVDDEPKILTGLVRTLHENYEVTTATSGANGLEVLEKEGPFALVISDMRMPEMSGAEFLSRVRKEIPDTVRILLTGYAELDNAIAAVNEGNIFRFLCKPCPVETLLNSVAAAVEQYRLVTAERDLLEKTLNGAVKVLTDVLSLASPEAFSRAAQIKSYVRRMTRALNVSEPWKYEIAAMLSQLGCITLPPETLHKIYAGESVSQYEQKIYNSHPEIGCRLLSQIPRMNQVAEIIRRQRGSNGVDDVEEMLGGEMLRIALAMDSLVASGVTEERARLDLQRKGCYSETLLDALIDPKINDLAMVVMSLPLSEFREGMILNENVLSLEGAVIIGKNTELHLALIERLEHFSLGVGVVEPISVRVPKDLNSA